MTFGEAIRAVLGKYADFDGRAGRPELLVVAALLHLGRRGPEPVLRGPGR